MGNWGHWWKEGYNGDGSGVGILNTSNNGIVYNFINHGVSINFHTKKKGQPFKMESVILTLGS